MRPYREFEESTYVFDQPIAISINKARLKHLNSLHLDIANKKVIDIGCGVGHLAQFFIRNNCQVFCIDGRRDNISSLRLRYPNLKSNVVDVEKENLSKYGTFDIVFCYGLLYHTKKPDFVIKNISRICKDLLLLETCITDSPEYDLKFVKDTPSVNQALYGTGCRPTPRFIISHLRASGFSNIYIPRRVPNHRDFQFKYRGDGSIEKDGHLIRQILIVSRSQLANYNLVSILDGSEFYQKDFLSKLPLSAIRILAEFIYKPREIGYLGHWQVGYTEGNLTSYRNFLKRLWGLLLLKSDKPATLVITWYNNIKLAISQDSEISRCVYIEGVYEPNQFYFLSKFLKKGMIFMDVGANIGLYSLFASRLVGKRGKVLAIEPSRREFNRFKQNLMLNKISNIKALKIALDESNSIKKFNVAVSPYDGHNSFGPFGYETTKIDHMEDVTTKTLDKLIQETKIKQIDAIKIDVEGAEVSVLKGALQTLKLLKPVLLMELSDRTLTKQGSKSDQIWKLLTGLSYIIYEFNQSSGKLREARQKKYYDGENVIAIPKNKSYLSRMLS